MRPQACDIDARKQQPQQPDADGRFERGDEQAARARAGRVLCIRGSRIERGTESLPLTRPNGESYVDLSRTVPYNFKTTPVKILMIAPEPFFEPRGTPFSEYHRIRALLELGHTVDLVTYPFGRDVSLPGLRVFRCLRPPFVTSIGIGPSLGQDPARFARRRAPRFAVRCRSATTPCTRTRRAAGSACLIAAMLGVPHLYDMHSSLPQQLTNFAFSQSRRSDAVFGVAGALRHPSLEGGRSSSARISQKSVRGIEPGGAGRADRERAGLRRHAGGRIRGSASAASSASRRTRRWCSTPGPSRRTRDSICCSPRRARVLGARPDARFVLAGGRPDQIAAARAAGGSGRRRRRGDLRRPASGRGDPGVPRCGRRARLAAQHRHEHAAEDLSVPALGPADRRDAPADAHPGAGRRGRDPDRRRPPEGFAAGILAALDGSGSRARGRRPRPRSWPRRNTATRPTSRAPARPAPT